MVSTGRMKMDPNVCELFAGALMDVIDLNCALPPFARRLPIDRDTAVVFYNKRINNSCHSPFITSLVLNATTYAHRSTRYSVLPVQLKQQPTRDRHTCFLCFTRVKLLTG